MQIRSIRLGMVRTNCYIFWEDGARACAVVDPGDVGQNVARLIQELGLEPVAILLTHSHFDHILGIPGLRESWPELPVYCHPNDVDPEVERVTLFGMSFPSISSFGGIRDYREGDTVQVGPLTVEVLHTPGHTPGSVTLRVGDVLFTGDTLFRNSMGRVDLPGGDYRKMMASLRRLEALPGDYQVYPGHESSTTLEEERACNPCIREALNS